MTDIKFTMLFFVLVYIAIGLYVIARTLTDLLVLFGGTTVFFR